MPRERRGSRTTRPYPVTLSNVGYQLSTTEIPLEELNSTSKPADRFYSSGYSDGTTLQPGGAGARAVQPRPSGRRCSDCWDTFGDGGG